MQFWDQLVEVDSLPIHLHDNHQDNHFIYCTNITSSKWTWREISKMDANTGVKNESKRSKRHGHSSLGSFPTHINRSLFRKQKSTKKITSAWRLVFLALTGNVGANEQKAHSI